jgi:hypothetical protein
MKAIAKKLGWKLVLLIPVLAAIAWATEQLGWNELDVVSDTTPGIPSRPRPAIETTHVVGHEPLGEFERSQGESILRRLREKWRQHYEFEQKEPRRCGWQPPGRFTREWRDGLTELRLFALGYPELAEAWAKGVAENRASPAWEEMKAIPALGYLAQVRWGTSESLLVDLCKNADPNARYYAQYLLSEADRAGHHRALYRELALQGDFPAVEALSYWRDAEGTKVLLEKIKSEWTNEGYPKGEARWQALEALIRLEALSSRAWQRLSR